MDELNVSKTILEREKAKLGCIQTSNGYILKKGRGDEGAFVSLSPERLRWKKCDRDYCPSGNVDGELIEQHWKKEPN